MPTFLENALKHEGRKRGMTGRELAHYVYGAMNNIGAMHGNMETAKGRRMQAKHERKIDGEKAAQIRKKAGM